MTNLKYYFPFVVYMESHSLFGLGLWGQQRTILLVCWILGHARAEDVIIICKKWFSIFIYKEQVFISNANFSCCKKNIIFFEYIYGLLSIFLIEKTSKLIFCAYDMTITYKGMRGWSHNNLPWQCCKEIDKH